MNAGWYIGKKVEVNVDRPLGSEHPKHSYMYPNNYGYLHGTKAGMERSWMLTSLGH